MTTNELPGPGSHVLLKSPHPYAGRIGFVLRSGDFDGGLQGPIVGGLLVDAGLAGPVVVRTPGEFERVTAIRPDTDPELVRVEFR